MLAQTHLTQMARSKFTTNFKKISGNWYNVTFSTFVRHPRRWTYVPHHSRWSLLDKKTKKNKRFKI